MNKLKKRIVMRKITVNNIAINNNNNEFNKLS